MKRGSLSSTIFFPALLMALPLAGCARYHAHPLPAAPDLLAKVPPITVSANRFAVAGLAPHPVPSRGLDQTTIMLLAVLHNPQLKAARLQAGVAGAQLLQAGLLPNPQLDAGFASSATNYGGALDLSEQITSWITRGAAKAAASANQRRVNLNILWLEWQTAAEAQQLFIQIHSGEQVGQVLAQSEALLAAQYQRDREAMLRGDALATAVSTDLTSLNQAESNQRQLQIQMNLARHTLNGLLGLQPDVRLHLTGTSELTPLSTATFRATLASVAHRRPDLLALQAGYKSQEENVRRAILGQFPALTAGAGLERDPVEGVNSFGPHVTLSLPLFDHNQGQIASERATRAVLWQDYQARLDAAAVQADEVRRAVAIQLQEKKKLAGQITTLQQMAAAAQQSLRQSNLNASAYTAMESSLLQRRTEAIRLQASIASAEAALRVLLGLPFSG